jgi:hypothetical protein
MEKISSTKKLPHWFDLNKYNLLNSSDSEILFYQVSIRGMLLNCLDDIEPVQEVRSDQDIDSDWPRTRDEYDDLCYWEGIKKHGIISKEIFELMEESILGRDSDFQNAPARPTIYGKKYLNFGNVIFPLRLIEAEHIGYRARNAIGAVENTHDEYLAIPWSFDPRKSYDVECGDNENIHLKISLNATDSEILGQLQRALPEYRKTLEIVEPKSIFKQSDLKRIVDCKIVELLDLRIWAKINNLNITHSVLATALFPDGSKGDTELRRTILPLAEKVLTDRYQDEWLSFI